MLYRKYLLIAALICIHPVSYANETTTTTPVKETSGLGMGAIIGGLIAGPPGAIIGAAGGAWLGSSASESDRKIAALEKALNAKSIELAYKQNELETSRKKFEKDFHRVMLNNEIQSLEKITEGITCVIHFKTNDTHVRQDIVSQVHDLARLIKPYPRINIQIAGYADARGPGEYNLRLSEQRAYAVRREFINKGIPAGRLQTHGYGESEASTDVKDREDYTFDRRVVIKLTLHEEV